METKRKTDNEQKKQESLFFKIGLAISLLVCIIAFEWKTYYVLPGCVLPPVYSEEATILIPITEHIPPTPKPVVMHSTEVIEVPSTDIIPVVEIPQVVPVEGDSTIETIPKEFTATTPEIVEPIVDFSEVEAEPIGGLKEFYRYLYGNMNAPIVEGIKNGKVKVQFVIENNGKVSHINIIGSLSPKHDAEVKRVFENAPSWKPAMNGGRPVRRRMSMDIKFRVE